MDYRDSCHNILTVAVVGWELAYPSESDPKNIKYVLWKTGLYRMNLDAATGTMMGNTGREKLVIGKTKVQLQERFGYLLTPAGASPYLRGCYHDSSWKNRDVEFIRKSPRMVVFDGDRAADLILVKGVSRIARLTCGISSSDYTLIGS